MRSEKAYQEILIKAVGAEKSAKLKECAALITDIDERLEWYDKLVHSMADGDYTPLVRDSIYRITPVDVKTFIEDPFYLDKKGIIYDKVLPHIVEINSGKYIECVLTGGIGSAKTTIAQYTSAYQLYVLSCIRNPHKLFDLDPASEILIVFQSLNLNLAKNLEYNRFKALVEGSPYFEGEFPFDKNIESRLRFPNRIEVVPVSGNEDAIIGQNVIGGLLDEVNYMKVIKDSKKDVDGGEFHQAKALYNSITRRRKSRFMVGGVIYGMLCLVSSKRYPGQFTDIKEKEHKKKLQETGKSDIYLYDKCAWDIKPKHHYSNSKWFWVFVGNDSRKPMVITDEEYERFPEEDRENNCRRIPEEYRSDFEDDILNALREVAGVSTLAKNPYLQNIDAVSQCFGSTISVLNRTSVVITKEKLKIKKGLITPIPRFAHVDLAKNQDSAGLCVGHVDRFITMNRGDVQEILPHVVIDCALEIVPPKFGDIEFAAIRELLYKLRDAGLFIKWVTYDSYQSVDSVQILKSKGFVTGVQSLDTKILPYAILKGALYDGRVSLPVHPVLERELRGLEYDAEKGKVDHPENNCVVGSTEILTKNGAKAISVLEKEGVYEVMTWDAFAGMFRYTKAVNPRITKWVTETVVLEFTDGTSLECTSDHPVLLTDGRYVSAGDLQPHHEIKSLYTSTDEMRVRKIVKKTYETPIPVYDITIPNTENFCLANGVVVHNSKDVADALAGVVYGLTMRREIWLSHNVKLTSIPVSIQAAVQEAHKKEEEA
ncbi:MAG: hypothetical protein GWN00_01160 [Aliifodinibius sp.]|nr:hypothetical protein [Fodinibius sp.]NIV09940.1 hypothetical protein [Fodinibius sp.]NIY23470.1 hypothetical protein [Fodinibius sp.]